MAEQNGCQDYWMGVKRAGNAFSYISHTERAPRKDEQAWGGGSAGKMFDTQASEPEFKSPQPMYKFHKCIWPIIPSCKKERQRIARAS